MKAIINDLQKKAFKAIASVPGITDEFYFTGGTALSECYLGHRESVDLDFFSDRPFDKSRVESAIAALGDSGISVRNLEKIHDRYQFEIFGSYDPPCKIDFCYYQYRRLESSGLLFHGFEVDSLRDIFTNKWATLFGRNEPKDVLDVACLVEMGKFGNDVPTLEKAAADLKRKFGLALQPYSMVLQYRSRLKSTNAEWSRGLLYVTPATLDVFSGLFKEF